MPTDYFESQIEISENDYTMTIADGKVEAKIDSAVYDATPSIRDTLHNMLESQFLGFKLSNRKAYKLSNPTKTRVEHADGRKNYILEVEPMRIKISFQSVTLTRCDKDRNVVADHQTEKKNLVDLVSKHHKDEALMSLLKSYSVSVDDPDDELVHLYEIRDALCRKFGNEKAARSELNIPKSKLNRFRILCNEEPLKQMRHRGKKYGTLRDATIDELSEAREIARIMIEAYLKYLDKTTSCSVSS